MDGVGGPALIRPDTRTDGEDHPIRLLWIVGILLLIAVALAWDNVVIMLIHNGVMEVR